MGYIKLMYITNNPEIASVAQGCGVDRIFVDMEYIGKDLRQGGMDTVQSRHTIEDIKAVRKVLNKSELLVRCNPIHEATDDYTSSKEEIDEIINSGADIIMLPYFKTIGELKEFIGYVDKRAKIMPLIETKEAAEIIDEILELDDINEIYIGLNDLSLSYGKSFMFELLSDGTVEALCKKFEAKGIGYGFGGIAALGKGDVPSEGIIKEHYRLGSTCAILSRTFCNTKEILDMNELTAVFEIGVSDIRELEDECIANIMDYEYFTANQKKVYERIKEVSCK